MTQQTKSKYHRQIVPGVWVDVYDVLAAFEVTEPELQHLIKKALAAGKRGHKDYDTDLNDIQKSITRLLERNNTWKENIAKQNNEETYEYQTAGAAVGISQRVRDEIAADAIRAINLQRVREAQNQVSSSSKHPLVHPRFFLTS